MDSVIEKYEGMIRNQPLKLINYDIELVSELSTAFLKGIIDKNMIRNALDKGELTLREYIKIINQ